MCLEPCFVKFPCLVEYSVYIDGSNMAYARYNQWNKPLLGDIILLIDYLIEKLGFPKDKIHCICDPSLKYHIDKPVEYGILVKEGLITEASKVADEFILGFALKHEFCFIISNDRFRQYLEQLPSKEWLENRKISFMIIDDEVCLSPNIDYKKIDELSLNGNKVNIDNDIKEEITTINVFKLIQSSEGEFDLFCNSQKVGEKKNG